MHGCSSGSALLVNAEVDSMRGVLEGGVGIGTKTSPRKTAIKKAQADLRQEYDVREERRKELEFLEKGGNPLDFKLGNAASASVQSTSLTNQHHEQFGTSEAKGSFALAASPHGDSVESSGRPGTPLVCEPNSADNLMLFDGENEFIEGERNYDHPSRTKTLPLEQFSQLDVRQNANELGYSAAFGLQKKAYKRRNRSRSNRDATRASSADVVPTRGGRSSSPSRNVARDSKGLICGADYQKDQNVSTNRDLKPTSQTGSMVLDTVPADNQLVMELDGLRTLESSGLTNGGLPGAVSDTDTSKNLRDYQHLQFGSRETASEMASERHDSVGGGEQVVSAGLECLPCVATTNVGNQAGPGEMNGFSHEKGDKTNIPNGGQHVSAADPKGLDSESSCTQTILPIDGNHGTEIGAILRNIVSNKLPSFNRFVVESITCSGSGICIFNEQLLASKVTPNMKSDELVKEKNETKADDSCSVINHDSNSVDQSHQGNGPILKTQEELNRSGPDLHIDTKDSVVIEGMETDGIIGSETQSKPCNLLGTICIPGSENDCPGTLQGSRDSFNQELLDTKLSARVSTVASEDKACSGLQPKVINEAAQNSVLEEARIIEAKRKRIAELSVGSQLVENHRISHWDYVIEEMSWLANDFAQERLWKISTAARISYQAAFTSQSRFEEQNSLWKQKNVAHTLAKAVMEFWHSMEETSKELELQCPEKDFALPVHGYSMRFLKYNRSHVPEGQAEAPVTPDRMSDMGILDMSWEDHLTEENLFYAVPAGAMDTYRKSIESYLMQCERTGSSMQEEVETSAYCAIPDFESQDNAYKEDDGETSAYYLTGAFEGSRSSKFTHKKLKKLNKACGARSYEVGADLQFMPCLENKFGFQQSVLMGKRHANSRDVSIPTKRVRTSSRPRLISPFSSVQAPSKTDASSGDTNSFQDDQSTLHGGSQLPNSMDLESFGDFEKQLPFESSEVSTKPKKKKNSKHLGSTYEQRWQLDSNFQNEQRDYLKKRSESHLESNGTSGLFGQHILKKPTIVKQSLDNSFDNPTPMIESIPSPVASQMSNMPNPNKFMKMLGGRDRGRKSKGLKIPAGQPGSGRPWSLFEDQALVVLVHDMGPNWEFVSDAINSALQFKCIFWKPKECKERHKILMDRTASDGADSAEDSGSSQPYPSTLPGIPKGSARQLFQRLQGPLEEDALKSHFEKIIRIGQKQNYRRTQNDNQDTKQLQQPHCSHAIALSQVFPNNLNGGSILTPLDLCDATGSGPDLLSFGYEVPHTSGLGISNKSTVAVAQMLPASGANSSVQGSSNMILGSNSSPSGPVNASVRDGRHGIRRPSSLSIDEQKRMQHYNQMISGKNIQLSGLSVPRARPVTDGGVRLLPGGTPTMVGLNRSMPMTRPMFQGITSSSVLNSGSMLSSGMVAMPSPVNMHSGAGSGSGQGNSMLRPRDALHLMRPSKSPESQRQIMVPEIQMQVSQGNTQGLPPFTGLSSSLSHQMVPAPGQSYPMSHQQPHPISPQQTHVLSNSHHHHIQGPSHPPSMQQHQAYAIRLDKEKYLQQRMHPMQQQQQQQQFAVSNASISHVQPQAQLPVSSPLQNSSQIQSQTSSPPLSPSPLTPTSSMTPFSQHQQKHHMPPNGFCQNAQTGGSGLTNKMGKQRQRQPQQQQQQFQQAGRQHPQQWQQLQSQQQTKLPKGVGRGNLMHQNLPTNPPLMNGLSTTPGSQSTERGEQFMNLMQGQGLYSVSGLNPVQPSKQLVPPHLSNQSHPQQKIYSSQTPPSSKQLEQKSSDNSNQSHVPPVTSGAMSLASRQAVPSLVSNHQQPQPQHHQKFVNQTQPNVRRVIEQNRQVSADPASKLQARDDRADQNSANNSSQIGRMVKMPQACVDATNVIPVVSSTGASQWRASETLYDSGSPNPTTELGSIGTPPLTNSAGSEPTTAISHGLGQKQSSGSLSSLGRDVDSQWQQQSQLQLPPTQEQQQQKLSLQHPQPQLLQAGSSSLYVRPTKSRLE